jgi:hypothetical protein
MIEHQTDFKTNQYRCLLFEGTASNTVPLTPQFDPLEIQRRKIVIKSIRFIPYADRNNDISLLAIYNDTLAAFDNIIRGNSNGRLNVSQLDNQMNGFTPQISINGIPLNIFNNANYPMDLFLDNINIEFPEAIDSGFSIITGNALYPQNYQITAVAPTLTPNFKVLIEVYLK